MKTLRIATRNSPLALWQAEYVQEQLRRLGHPAELVAMQSGGDTDMRPIDGTRQVGVFTKRIQEALLHDEADVAVHSLKDLPTEKVPELTLAAVPVRERVHDSLVSPNAWTLDGLPQQARVGTGSRRRAAQLRCVRPDLVVEPIRGNVQTRLSKLDAGQFDAIVLAEAGILRLKLDHLSRQSLDLDQMLSAPGQGALGIETRLDDVETTEVVAQLNDLPTRVSVTAERHLLASLHGGCLAPIAALAEAHDQRLVLRAVVLSEDGAERIEETGETDFTPDDAFEAATSLADQLSRRMIERGASRLIAAQR